MQLEERVRNLQLAKDELAAQHTQQTNALGETHSRAHQLALEGETLKRRIEDLIQQLANKSQETVAEVAKVKLEYQHKLARLEQEHLAMQELYDRIGALEREIEGASASCSTRVPAVHNTSMFTLFTLFTLFMLFMLFMCFVCVL